MHYGDAMLGFAFELLWIWWPYAAAVVNVALALLVTGHVAITKKYARSAVSWIALVWFAPFFGALLYLVFGINRIRRRAERLDLRGPVRPEDPTEELGGLSCPADLEGMGALRTLCELVSRVSGQPLTSGNSVDFLVDGPEAYPAMLDAIEGAERSVALVTYIFDRDPIGEDFVAALARAHERGVEVRVLVDGFGAWYSRPPITRALHRRGVPCALFLFSWNPLKMAFLNLRNHRKLLVVDGQEAYTGGMNIRGDHDLARGPREPTRDLMVRLRGPVVQQLLEVFRVDWAFTTGEALDGPAWLGQQAPAGDVHARAVSDGPDEEKGRFWKTLLGALSCAQERVAVVTPYFLPEEEIEAALETAAQRGVRVDVFLPARSNLPFVDHATRAELPDMIAEGVRFWYVAAPFDHTKLMVVDEAWVHLGSSNWDARSLTLHFELNVELYDREAATRAWELVEERRRKARLVTRQELDARSLPMQLLDGLLRLGKPYL